MVTWAYFRISDSGLPELASAEVRSDAQKQGRLSRMPI